MFIEEPAMHRKTPIVSSITTAACAAALTACAVGPAYHPPHMELPGTFRNGGEIAAVAASSPDAVWWAGFHDPLLTQIIERTLAQNLDLAAAAARVNQARAAAALAGAALLPQGTLAASGASAQDSLTSPLGKIAHAVGGPRNYQTYSAGAQASWELDLFGSLSRRREAARADAGGAETGQAAIRIAISAEAADAYLDLRGLQAQLRLADSQEETQSRLVELVRLRLGQGVSSDRELQRAIGELERVRALKPTLRAAIDADMYRLDVLMGTPAGTHHAELAAEAEQPTAPQPVGSVAPADLMQRRPDIAVAERHLAAANARIGAAIAEYYPHLTFSGLTGFESVDAGSLFASAARENSALIGLRWRLFDFGRVDAEVAIARGREQEALAAYRGTVLQATQDVEAALSQFIESRSEAEVLRREISALTRAREQAQTAYEGGVLPLLEVLDADRDLLAARDRLAAANAGEARAAVASFRALGGGWTG
jgi:NodT family efflux transporter outer membrane factor (OMF) lipoprotein